MTFHVYNSHYTTHPQFYGTVQSADGKIFVDDRNLKNSMVVRNTSGRLEAHGHYTSESNGDTRVYNHIDDESDSSLEGYVNKTGQFFNRSGRLLGHVDQEGYIYNDRGLEKARVELRIHNGKNFEDARVDLEIGSQKKLSSELLVKVFGVAALSFGLL